MDNFISPFIPGQFPQLYKDNQSNLIAFVQAYYEWMEQNYLGTLNVSYSNSGNLTLSAGQTFVDLNTGATGTINFVTSNIPSKSISLINVTITNNVDIQIGDSLSINGSSSYLTVTNVNDAVGPLGIARSIQNYTDINSTADTFLSHFINTYMQSIPTTIAADPRLLIKHIKDLYLAKGTPKAYELLFRLVFNESITIDTPGQYVFKPSDNTWKVPRYIEVNDNPYLVNSVGMLVYNFSRTASAVVESVARKIINGKSVNIVYISSENGRFRYNDNLLCDAIPQWSNENSPRVIGSLSVITIENGGYNLNVGDVLDVIGTGINAKARITSTVDENGKISFNLSSGGMGYTLTPQITVATTINLLIDNAIGMFSFGDIVTDETTNANGYCTYANSSFVQLIDFSQNLSFVVGHNVTNQTSSSSATITSVLGGGGSGASFSVGNIINPQTYTIDLDSINNQYNTVLDSPSSGFYIDISSTSNTFTVGNTVTSSANVIWLEGNYLTSNTIAPGELLSNTSLGISGLYVYRSDGQQLSITGTQTNLTQAETAITSGVVLVSSVSSSQFQIIDHSTIQTITGTANVTYANSTVIEVNGSGISNMGYFVPNSTITDTHTSHTALITSTIRKTDWDFQYESTFGNLDAMIIDVLKFESLVTGTIAYLSDINPGGGYTTAPYINIVEPAIAALNINDSTGGVVGNDAVVSSTVLNAQGIASSVEVVDSGFGFNPDESVTLQSSNNNIVINGVSIVDLDGIGLGRWTSDKSFVSDLMKLQDSYYYQPFAYEIAAQRMLSTYQNLVNNLVHPSGIALFGKFQLNSNLSGVVTQPTEFSITQSS